MNFRTILYYALSIIGLGAVLSATTALSMALLSEGSVTFLLRVGLASFAISTLCIESRIRMGYRLDRTMLFWTHLTFATPFFVLLGLVVFLQLPIPYFYVDYLLFIGVLATGSVLYHRGMMQTLRKKDSVS